MVPDILALLRDSSRTLPWNQLNRSASYSSKEKVISPLNFQEYLSPEFLARELVRRDLPKPDVAR